jgi:hypothetical protein
MERARGPKTYWIVDLWTEDLGAEDLEAEDLEAEDLAAEDLAPAPRLTQALKPSISSHNAPYWPL